MGFLVKGVLDGDFGQSGSFGFCSMSASMNDTGRELTAFLALSDLSESLAQLPAPAAAAVQMTLQNLPPEKWDVWIKTRLLQSSSSSYWKGMFPGVI